MEKASIDENKFKIRTGKKLKRSAKPSDSCKNADDKCVFGHYGGPGKVLPYIEARKLIYLPLYEAMLDTFLQDELASLYNLHLQFDLILLDFFTNDDVDDARKPLSHSSLIKARLHRMFQDNKGKPIMRPSVE